MANDVKISVWLSDDLHADLIKLADADDRPVSAFVRRLIERELDLNLVPSERAGKGRSGSRLSACDER